LSKIHTTIYLEKATLTALSKLALKERRSMAELIRIYVEDGVKKAGKR
jgi:hypothetical protein